MRESLIVPEQEDPHRFRPVCFLPLQRPREPDVDEARHALLAVNVLQDAHHRSLFDELAPDPDRHRVPAYRTDCLFSLCRLPAAAVRRLQRLPVYLAAAGRAVRLSLRPGAQRIIFRGDQTSGPFVEVCRELRDRIHHRLVSLHFPHPLCTVSVADVLPFQLHDLFEDSPLRGPVDPRIHGLPERPERKLCFLLRGEIGFGCQIHAVHPECFLSHRPGDAVIVPCAC